ncbi:MAG: phospholipase C [Marmoricola sp.]
MALFDGMTRRDFTKLAATAGGVAALNSMAGPVIERAFAADPCGTGSLSDIEHFVFLMQENRSFDHYFGTMSGVRGFNDPGALPGIFAQKGYNVATKTADPNSAVMPFRLDTTHGATLDGEAINDPTHAWGPQHQAWNNGAMDQWVKVHVANDGVANGPATMGYYKREDIPVHFALADAFTVCDRYFCSVLGPTDPNRLYWISGTIDPEGTHGGPLLETPTLVPMNKYSWETYPERLQEAGVSWKVYTSQQAPVVSGSVLSGMLGAFKKFQNPLSPLYQKGLAPIYPVNFASDVKNNKLPKVSWIIPDLLACEHPALPPSFGAAGILKVLDILTSNPAVWEKTALIISYDENGGFFDHVPPPTAPPGTPGEYVTKAPLSSVKSSAGIAGPIGLGFRVPGMVISPYSRGGLVAGDTFDHTSQLRLVETRYGVEVPNLSAWRRATVGDMTTAFDFASAVDPTPPNIVPRQERTFAMTMQETRLGLDIIAGTFFASQEFRPYPVPPNSMPTVESGPQRGTPSGPADCAPSAAAEVTTTNSVPGLTDIVADPTPSRIALASEQLKAKATGKKV